MPKDKHALANTCTKKLENKTENSLGIPFYYLQLNNLHSYNKNPQHGDRSGEVLLLLNQISSNSYPFEIHQVKEEMDQLHQECQGQYTFSQ